ncbi:MAG: sigma-70 family RNA polymerase sigma factor [Nevskiaceae bacterium]|nr:MAG: sigma-70 family RNA polymerase sigma factor [Nevskiaceae bacterium]TBR71669.1 MAG: sigma-70 family RNA polymerase sigma factor [Nevskiaceae bacterium]
MTPAGTDERNALARLLQRSGEHDQRAFASLYARTSPKLYGVCLRMLRERGEAEDALQNVYINVWRRADSYDAARASAMTWLITLTRNQCIDRLRQHREAPVDTDVLETLVDPAPEPDASSEAGEQHQRLERCLQTLSPEQQSAVRAAFFTGATYNELAEHRSVPLATMKSWIRRSLIRLRNCLES